MKTGYCCHASVMGYTPYTESETNLSDIEIGFDISDEDHNEIYRGTGQIKTDLVEQYDYQRPSYRETIISEAAQDYFGYTMSYFSEEELQNIKKGIISTIKSIDDEQDTEVTYFFGQELSIQKITIDEYIKKIENVTKEQIIEVANTVTINTIYFLRNFRKED